MESVLVTGGAHGDLPSIRACKELGYRVVSGGNRPSDPGHKESDSYEDFNYADYREVLRVASENGVVGIVPSCHDLAAVAAARAAAVLGLPGHDNPDLAQTIHSKHLLRQTLESVDIPTPRAFAYESLEEAAEWVKDLGKPALLKPSDLAGGRGISRIDDVSQLEEAHVLAWDLSINKSLVLEEFVSGTNHGISVLIHNNRPMFTFADDEYYGRNPFRVLGARTPTSLSIDELNQVLDHVTRFAGSLNLVDGLLHLQVIAGADQVYVIEVCRRLPGDFYPRLVELSTGHPYTLNIIRAFLGLEMVQRLETQLERPMIRHVLTADRSGVLTGFEIPDSLLTQVRESEIWAQLGDRIEDPLTWSGGALFFSFPEYSSLHSPEDMSSIARAQVS